MESTELQAFIGVWLPKLEAQMRAELVNEETGLSGHYGMLQYHMGWADEDFAPKNYPAGKRLRPMFCLLACAELGGDPEDAIPAAAAIELLHNFSLIHDDVEDGDEVRRHRPTVWALWGVPQAINAGDGMFSIAFAAIQRLDRRGVDARITLDALQIFTTACIALTEGQYLDISFERRSDVTVEEYLRMINGKTAALIDASIAIGAIIGGGTPAQQKSLGHFGRSLGLAFQIQDDILGIWGDPAVTGKAAGNDILRRKKSLPLLYALNHDTVGPRLEALMAGDFGAEQLPQAMALLDEAGARAFAEDQLLAYHESGVAAIDDALGDRAAGSAMRVLADSLLNRTA